MVPGGFEVRASPPPSDQQAVSSTAWRNVLQLGTLTRPSPPPASAPVGGLDSGPVAAVPRRSGANPGLEASYPSFVNSGGNDSGLRNTAVKQAESTPGSGIPKSNFYPSPDRESACQPRIGQPVSSE